MERSDVNLLRVWTKGAPEELYLKSTVILCHTDVNAAAIRAVLGIQNKLEYWTMKLDGLGEKATACQRADGTPIFEKDFEPLQVLNCKYEDFSFVIINTVLENNECHQIVRSLFQLFEKWNVDRVLLLSAVLTNNVRLKNSNDMYEMAFHTKPLTKLPTVPEAMKIRDTFINTLIQFATVDGFPLICYLKPANRARDGLPGEADESIVNIKKFQEILNTLYRLKFDDEVTNGIHFSSRRNKDSLYSDLLYM